MPIQILDQNTINKIAAGEVIERPASVVKELAENAIDAMATAVTIEIKDGGISFIRITDNGCGIDKGEIPMAFLRHSTSKIKSVEDLMCVRSLGFRGEALSSIAAVAQIELITKTKEAFTGVRYVIEGGKEQNMEDIGAPDGTTFIVRNLFYNTPVRRKFLKTATTEAGYVSALVEHLAFSHPEISFRFINNGQNKLYTSGNGSLKDIIYHVNGRDIATNLLEVSAKTQDIQISGFIGKPMISRGNRTYENYFINGRYIKSNIITRAIEEGYKGYIMQHQYPFTALHFTIEQSIIDVNVHPTKMELRFSQNEFVYDFVLNAIRNTLSRRELVPEVRLGRSENVPVNKTRPAEPFEVKRMAAEAAKDKKNSTAGITAAPAATGHTLRQAYVSDTIRPKQLREDPAEYKTTAAIEPSAAPAARPPEAPVTETLQESASPAPEQLSLITPDDTASIPKPVLVGQEPNLFLTLLTILYAALRSPSKYSTVSTICSSTLGPATTPSLVTWPTINIDIPMLFAICIRTEVDSLTWLTLPGAELISSRYIVWIESIITISGLTDLIADSTASRFVSHKSCILSVKSPIRPALNLICLSDSSPDIYSTFLPAAETLRHI